MIMLSGKKKVDCRTYDHVWYATTTCPGMRTGCEHHPEIAGSKKLEALFYEGKKSPDEIYAMYVEELTSEPKISYLRELVRRSEAGEWFQLIFYEDSPTEGERPYMYAILKEMTSEVFIE